MAPGQGIFASLCTKNDHSRDQQLPRPMANQHHLQQQQQQQQHEQCPHDNDSSNTKDAHFTKNDTALLSKALGAKPYEQTTPNPVDSPQITGSDTDADASVLTVEGPPMKRSDSIYNLHSQKKRYLLLCISALGSTLVPLCDTVYLPALKSLQIDFNTTQSLINASIAVYMFTVGLAVLFWGPCADKFGRRPVFLASTAGFIGTSLVCYFSPNIGVLIAFRGLQGAVAAAFSSTGVGMLADIIPPEMRGTAMGIANIPMFIGPILGPVVGGALSQSFGWRSTFLFVIVYAGAILLPLLYFVVPETHQYIVLQRIKKKDLVRAQSFKEFADIEMHPPVFQAPWYPYQILCDRQIALHGLTTLVGFASMFCCVVELSWFLAQPPYLLTPAMVGIACLAQNAAGFFFCPIGGRMSDIGYKKNANLPQLKLLYNNTTNLILLPISLLAYGWAFHYKLHMAVALVALFLVGVSTSIYVPSVFSFITTIKQANAAAACAGVHSLMFIASGVLLLVAAEAVYGMGVGWFFTMLACLNIVCSSAAALQICRDQKLYKQQQQPFEAEHAAQNGPQVTESTADGDKDPVLGVEHV